MTKKEKSMPKSDMMEVEGTVVLLSHGIFKVKLDNDVVITCVTSGQIKKNSIKILVNDRVKVEMSPYDLLRGRITYRLK